MGRLWQSLILSRWNPLLAWLPVETVIHNRQADYYKVLGARDKAANSTAFIEFMLSSLLTALRDASSTAPGEQVDAQVSEQVVAILRACAKAPQPKSALLKAAGLSNAYLNYKRHILPLLHDGLLGMTLPDKPNSRLQKYRLTATGAAVLRS